MSTSASGPRPSDKFIPWYIAGFFLLLTLLFGYFVYISKTTYTGLVTDHAYERGLAYNDVIKNSTAQEALGFKPLVTRSGQKIIFTLSDRDARPVHVRKVKILLFRPVQDGMDVTVEMAPEGTGFSAVIIPPQPGLWELRIEADTAAGPYFMSKRMTFE